MTYQEVLRMADKFLGAWNTQDVELTVAVYTDDVTYLDPNTRGPVRGSAAMRRYLTKLFANWQMHWSLREAHLFEGGDGCAILWHATLRPIGTDPSRDIHIDGMDFVQVRDGRISRNEVYFDRMALAALMSA